MINFLNMFLTQFQIMNIIFYTKKKKEEEKVQLCKESQERRLGNTKPIYKIVYNPQEHKSRCIVFFFFLLKQYYFDFF
jgi:hypothetical protein